MTDILWASFFGFLAGVAGAMGLGGGGFLIIYLTIFANVPQIEAQGINLIFFIPCAAVSLIFHKKSGLIEFSAVKSSLPYGFVGAILGTIVSSFIKTKWLSYIFAAFLLVLGVKTVWSSGKAMLEKYKSSRPHKQ